MGEELMVLLVNEGTTKSIITDIFTFGCLVAVLFINNRYLGNSAIVILTICISFFIQASVRGSRKIKRMSAKEAYEYLKIQQGA